MNNFIKLNNIKFNIKKLQNITNKIINIHTFNDKSIKNFGGSINLKTNYKESEPQGPWIMLNQDNKEQIIRSGYEWNEAFNEEKLYTNLRDEFKGTYFEEINNILNKHYNIGRLRLILKEPRTCLTWHRDPEIRLHVPIFSDPGNFMIVDKEMKYLKPDGSVYLTNTKKYHNVFNGSNTNRIHLVAVCLDDAFSKFK